MSKEEFYKMWPLEPFGNFPGTLKESGTTIFTSLPCITLPFSLFLPDLKLRSRWVALQDLNLFRMWTELCLCLEVRHRLPLRSS
jgi:hypothetical protein